MQAGLLAAIAAEQAPPVRREAAAAVAAAARVAVPAGQWPQLLPWLGGLAHSARAEDRETALVLFCSLTDTIGVPRTRVPLCMGMSSVSQGCWLLFFFQT